MDLLLALLSVACCLATPTLLLGAPLLLLARRAARARPAWRVPIVLGLSVLDACASAALLGVAGFLSAFTVSLDDGAGEAPLLFAGFGAAAGAALGLLISLVALSVATRSAVPAVASSPHSPPMVDDVVGTRVAVLAIATLVFGVGTSLVGLLLSVSLGMLSLGVAQIAVRPIALLFCVLHVVVAGGSFAVRARVAPAWKLRVAIGVSLVGALIASLIAAFGPTFFESALDAAARGLSV